MISIVITSYNEAEIISRAIEAALNQKTEHKYDVIVSAPDDETLNVAREYSKRDKRVRLFKDPGKGKMFALNLLFKKINWLL